MPALFIDPSLDDARISRINTSGGLARLHECAYAGGLRTVRELGVRLRLWVGCSPPEPRSRLHSRKSQGGKLTFCAVPARRPPAVDVGLCGQAWWVLRLHATVPRAIAAGRINISCGDLTTAAFAPVTIRRRDAFKTRDTVMTSLSDFFTSASSASAVTSIPPGQAPLAVPLLAWAVSRYLPARRSPAHLTVLAAVARTRHLGLCPAIRITSNAVLFEPPAASAPFSRMIRDVRRVRGWPVPRAGSRGCLPQ